MTDKQTCPACGVPFSEHLGLIGTCKKLRQKWVLADQYRIALADAIRRPMGVVPDSADGLITQDELEAAEKRRPKHGG